MQALAIDPLLRNVCESEIAMPFPPYSKKTSQRVQQKKHISAE